MNAIEHSLLEFGAALPDLHLFDYGGPELLRYATLIGSGSEDRGDTRMFAGVQEWQGAPLMFVVDGKAVGDDKERLRKVRRLAALRGDAPYLGVVFPGRLEIFSVGLDALQMEDVQVVVGDANVTRSATFAILANLRPKASRSTNWISDVVLRLLTRSMDELKRQDGVSDETAISLIGRALFTRFLADRGLLTGSEWGLLDPNEVFDEAKTAKIASDWLDRTFNGDFLPLDGATFRRLSKESYRVLGDILRKAPEGQLFLGWQERWDNLDFAHIPVGVLSQAYEHYLRKHEASKQRREGGYYTPAPIAEMMVDASFAGLSADVRPDEVRVLDPAAGAGVFLTIAFRRLVQERWRRTGVRPDTADLRRILYGQITGFDINESALRFAALGLYLACIELDAHPEPVEKLHFEKLRSVVLHKFTDDSTAGRSLGSLGPLVGKNHANKYDIVIGNPPWASATRLPNWSQVKTIVGEIADARIKPETDTEKAAKKVQLLPNEVLDLGFVWRALEWAKPGAQITFALHGRLLFQQGDGMPAARNALLAALDVRGIINAAHLRQTKVWPNVYAPFCILFAKNQTPPFGAGFSFLTPRQEADLNRTGAMRIDSGQAVEVTRQELLRTPALLKMLSRGGRADAEICMRLRENGGLIGLGAYWSKLFEGRRGRAGNGYQKLRPSSRTRKGETEPGVKADFLAGLPEITKDAFERVEIRSRGLPKFDLKRIHDPRPRSLFTAPLLLVHKSPPASFGRIRSAVAKKDVVFNESYYGYSAEGHEEADLLTKYLALLVSSKPAFWFVMMTSGEIGFERDVVEMSAVDGIPVRPLSDLTGKQKRLIERLFGKIAEGQTETWSAVDRWAADLYGLEDEERDVIFDTLRFNLPFADNERAAQLAPATAQVREFCSMMEHELRPWAEKYHRPLAVRPFSDTGGLPWRMIEISHCRISQEEQIPRPASWADFTACADDLGATELSYSDEKNRRILIGRLNQARYWSRTAAREVAEWMVWNHVDFLSGRGS